MNWKKKVAIATAFTGMTISAIHIVNRVLSYNASRDNVLRIASGFTYNWKFGKIFYKKMGIGSPLLLIHDLQAFSSSEEWNAVIGEFSKKHTVYAIDLLGCGRSEKPNIMYTNYLYLQMINDFIKQVIGNKTNVISMGESSSFVLGACSNNKDIINKIIMVSPCSIKNLSTVPTSSSKTASWLVNSPILGTLLYHILYSKGRIRAYFNKEYFHVSDSYAKNMLDAFYESAHVEKSAGKHLASSLIGRYTTAQVNAFIKNIENSVYIISGDHKFDDLAIIEEYQNKLPSIECTQILNCGALPQMDKSEEFLEHVSIYLS
ncbi:MAG: alpha/beta fold hydrolase [Suipraeoptans sp.]